MSITAEEHHVTGRPKASVVIPAHSEEAVIGDCLQALVEDPAIHVVDVVVVANGCTDRTVEVVRAFSDRIPCLTVLELPQASKSVALNAGDDVCRGSSRIYLDADIVLSGEALSSLVTTLDVPRAISSAPSVVFATEGCSPAVRGFYRTFRRLPYATAGLVGLGVYGVSEEGRRRFGRFPAVISDDLFVQRLFADDERTVCGGYFTVRAPRTLRALVDVRTRTAQGNAQLADTDPAETLDSGATTTGTIRGLVDLVRHDPRMAGPAVTYAAVVATARWRARRNPVTAWLRDESTRTELQSGCSPTLGLPAVAYLVSQYPAPSHVFIEREVVALRENGTRVLTFSVRPTPPALLLSPLMRSEAAGTVVLQNRPKLVRMTLGLAARHPAALLRAVLRALDTGDATPRARLWQLFYLAEAVVLMDALQKAQVRHVHVHFANNAADVARATVGLGRDIDGPSAGWRWTFSMHGPTELENVERWDLANKVRSASGVACISDFTRSQLMRRSDPSQWDKLAIVPMSVDTYWFGAPPAGRHHDGPLRVLFLGRLVPEKGPSVLLDAVERLQGRGTTLEVRIAGDGELLDPLADEVRRRRLQGHVTLCGPVGQEDVVRLYHWADVFCLPSFSEGLPVVLMEAMATELPVVTTYVAGIPELVEDKVTGRIVPAGRADAVAEAIAELEADPGERAALGARARDRVVARHATEVTVPALQRFLDGSSQGGAW